MMMNVRPQVGLGNGECQTTLDWVMMNVRTRVGLSSDGMSYLIGLDDDGCQTSLDWVMMDVRPQVGLGSDGCLAAASRGKHRFVSLIFRLFASLSLSLTQVLI